MRILQWAFPYLPTKGGREIFIQRLSEDLYQRGHQLFIISNENALDSPLCETSDSNFPLERINLHLLKGSNQPELFSTVRDHAVAKIEEWQPEIIHLHNIYDTGAILLIEALKKLSYRPKVILTYHGLAGREILHTEKKFRFMGPYLDRVVLPSQINFDYFQMYTPFTDEKLRLIYNGVPTTFDSDRTENPDQYFLYAGRLSFDKGVGVLLSAWKLISRRHPHLRLKIAGEGRMRNILQDFANEIAIAESVDFLGWIPSNEIAELIKGSIAVVVPSTLTEPFGLIAAEAQALGVPVIASQVGGLGEIVEDDVTGFLIPPGDFGSLTQAMNYLIDNPDVRVRFGAAATIRMREHFSLDKSHKAYEDLYFEMIGPAQ